MKATFCLLLLAVLLSAGCSTVSSSSSFPLQYKNAGYGFAISLPASWQEFSVLQETWEGGQGQSVQKITIRHPQWSAKEPYQDIPIYVFAIKQWEAMERGEFSIHAGGMEDEMFRNSKYVFVEHNRDFAEGLKGDGEVREILRNVSAQHPEVVERAR